MDSTLISALIAAGVSLLIALATALARQWRSRRDISAAWTASQILADATGVEDKTAELVREKRDFLLRRWAAPPLARWERFVYLGAGLLVASLGCIVVGSAWQGSLAGWVVNSLGAIGGIGLALVVIGLFPLATTIIRRLQSGRSPFALEPYRRRWPH